MPGVIQGRECEEVPASVEAAEAMYAFGSRGVLPPGAWFVAPRDKAWFTTYVHHARWDDEISEQEGWRPVGGPLVGAQMACDDARFIVVEWRLEFDQEAHPFGRFDLGVSSLIYQDPASQLRLFIPLPESRDRVSIWMRSTPGVHACEAFVPGVMP